MYEKNTDYEKLKKELELKKRERLRKEKIRRMGQIFSLFVFAVVITAVCVAVNHKGNKEEKTISVKSVSDNKQNSSDSSQGTSLESSSISSGIQGQQSIETFIFKDEASREENSSADSSSNNTDDKEKNNKKSTKTDNLSALTKEINSALEGFEGEWSVYVKNLDTDKSITINNQQVYAASLIKLFAMSCAYQQIEDGNLSEEDVYDTIFRMITESSNEDFNSLVWDIGRYSISDWCLKNGYENTSQCHGLYPAENADGLATYSGYNLTTAEDCGRLLESIYKGKCVSKKYSDKMLQILLQQQLVNKIPAGLPDGVKCANKTGETDDVCHDAAIVYSQGCDYILTVTVSNPEKAYDNEDDLIKLSKIVYDYFN